MLAFFLLSCQPSKVSTCQDACAIVYETCGFQGSYGLPADVSYAACLDEECPESSAADEWAACILSDPPADTAKTCQSRLSDCGFTPCENGPWYDRIGWWCEG